MLLYRLVYFKLNDLQKLENRSDQLLNEMNAKNFGLFWSEKWDQTAKSDFFHQTNQM